MEILFRDKFTYKPKFMDYLPIVGGMGLLGVGVSRKSSVAALAGVGIAGIGAARLLTKVPSGSPFSQWYIGDANASSRVLKDRVERKEGENIYHMRVLLTRCTAFYWQRMLPQPIAVLGQSVSLRGHFYAPLLPGIMVCNFGFNLSNGKTRTSTLNWTSPSIGGAGGKTDWVALECSPSLLSNTAMSASTRYGGDATDYLLDRYVLFFLATSPVTGEVEVYLDNVTIESL